MNNELSLTEFASDPDTVSFIIRASEYVINLIKDNPKIKLANTLLDKYIYTYVNKNDIDEIVRVFGSNLLSISPAVYGLLDEASLGASGITQVHEQPFLDLMGTGVLVGIVDTGIDYTNDAFRYEDGTSKIVSIYDETMTIKPPPFDFILGTEFTNEEINNALNSENPLDIVPSTDTVGHGTFLASLAAGRKRNGYGGAAPDAELVVVKLRKARSFWIEKYLVPPEQENVFDGIAIMAGIEYIVRKANSLNRPVAICLGLGSNLGSHNGYSIFEELLYNISTTSGICICAAAGNQSQARAHTQGVIARQGETQNIEFRVAEQSNIFINIRNEVANRISVSLKSPTGEIIERVPAKIGTLYSTRLILERARVDIEYFFPMPFTGGQITIIRLLDATPGIWTITIHGDIILEGNFHAYLPMIGLGPPGVEFLSPTPEYTVVVPATSFGVIACGAYDASNNTLYTNSSWGPTTLGFLVPTLVAPGVNVGGIYPAGPGTMTGTSVASAITTGACALMLQWGIVQGNDVSLSAYQIKAFLIRGCERDSNIVYPNNQWGYGRLNLLNSFTMMREL